MSEEKDVFLFTREVTRLYAERQRCKDKRLEAKIAEDITLLKEAMELLSISKSAT